MLQQSRSPIFNTITIFSPDKCTRPHVFYISLVFLNARRVYHSVIHGSGFFICELMFKTDGNLIKHLAVAHFIYM